MKIETFPIVMVALSELEGAHNPAQPENRTEAKALHDLKEAISETHYIAPILIANAGKGASARYTPLDGHRRIAAAIELGITHVPCFILPTNRLDVRSWFILLNRGIKNFTGRDWFYVWAMSDGVLQEKMPSMVKNQIDGAVQFVGMQEAIRYGRERATSASQFRQIRTLLGRLVSYDYPQTIEARRRLTAWVIEHNQWKEIREVEDLLARKAPAKAQAALERIHRCIEKNCPVWDHEKGTYTRPGARKLKAV